MSVLLPIMDYSLTRGTNEFLIAYGISIFGIALITNFILFVPKFMIILGFTDQNHGTSNEKTIHQTHTGASVDMRSNTGSILESGKSSLPASHADRDRRHSAAKDVRRASNTSIASGAPLVFNTSRNGQVNVEVVTNNTASVAETEVN
jgi:hypothetical protein